jgi:cyclic pyranopterin phosphate synthase
MIDQPDTENIDPEKFCYYPFTQLLLQPTGDISPCCWNQKIILGTAPECTLNEAWNGERLRALRREFLEGKPTSCRTQMEQIGCHRWSRRPAPSPLNQISFSERQTAAPRRLDLRLNGKCNLQCVMCDVWKQPNGIFDDSDFWTKGPTEIFPFLEEIDLLGGEPLIQADTFRLIDAVLSCNTRCSWGFVTNGQYKFSGTIQKQLSRLNLRWIQLSLDSVNHETYAKIRRQGKLERALETLQALRHLRASQMLMKNSTFQLSLSMCVQKLNWQEVGEFLTFARQASLSVDLQFAYGPDDVSLFTLPEPERRAAIRYFEDLESEFSRSQLNPLILPLKESLGVESEESARG